MRDHYHFTHWRSLHFQRKERYYFVKLEQDLFGSWIVILNWGKSTSHQGRIVNKQFNSLKEAEEFYEKTISRRINRGYIVVNKVKKASA